MYVHAGMGVFMSKGSSLGFPGPCRPSGRAPAGLGTSPASLREFVWWQAFLAHVQRARLCSFIMGVGAATTRLDCGQKKHQTQKKV